MAAPRPLCSRVWRFLDAFQPGSIYKTLALLSFSLRSRVPPSTLSPQPKASRIKHETPMQTLSWLYGETRLSWLPSAPWHVLDPEYPHPVCYKSCTAPDGRFVPHGSAYTFLMYSRTGTINTLPSTTIASPPPPKTRNRPPRPSPVGASDSAASSPSPSSSDSSTTSSTPPLRAPSPPSPHDEPPENTGTVFGFGRRRSQLQSSRDFSKRSVRNAGGMASLKRGDSWGVRQSDHHAVYDLYALALANKTASEKEKEGDGADGENDPRKAFSDVKDLRSNRRSRNLKRMLKKANQKHTAAKRAAKGLAPESPAPAPAGKGSRVAPKRASGEPTGDKGVPSRFFDYFFGFGGNDDYGFSGGSSSGGSSWWSSGDYSGDYDSSGWSWDDLWGGGSNSGSGECMVPGRLMAYCVLLSASAAYRWRAEHASGYTVACGRGCVVLRRN